MKAGDHVNGIFRTYYSHSLGSYAALLNSRILAFQKFFVLPSLEGFRVLENKEKLPWSTYVGAAGMPGQTAFFGWKEGKS